LKKEDSAINFTILLLAKRKYPTLSKPGRLLTVIRKHPNNSRLKDLNEIKILTRYDKINAVHK
jgi:hypothetical protein